jgi:SAM-dependent methyltransferase
LSAAPLDVREERIGGVPYVAFDTELPLSTRDVAVLANLSTAFALFEVIDGDLLRPLTLAPLARYDDDLITIPKYAGKTNEHFTKLLLNVTVLASTRAARLLDGGLTVLDPLCGRGTTLNQALMYGFDAIGIEVVGKDVDAYAAFLKTWLRRKRHKHTTDLSRVRREKRLVARRFDVSVAPSPEAHRAGDVQHLTVFHADTTRAREFLPAQAADVIVADLPYGVAHGSRTAGGLDRRPLELLRVAVPVWVELLRPGGTLGMSWNTRVARRDDAAAILTGAGLSVVYDPAYRGFEHWVDQTITRDILVARSR